MNSSGFGDILPKTSCPTQAGTGNLFPRPAIQRSRSLRATGLSDAAVIRNEVSAKKWLSFAVNAVRNCSLSSARFTERACSIIPPSRFVRLLGCAESRGNWVQFRSEEHTSELQSLMRISYAVFCLKNKTKH